MENLVLRKHWIISLFVLATALLMPQRMWAEDNYDLIVAGNGVTITSGETTTISGNGITGTVSITASGQVATAETYTLTLNGATIAGNIIWNKATTLNVELIGNNTITGETSCFSGTADSQLSFQAGGDDCSLKLSINEEATGNDGAIFSSISDNVSGGNSNLHWTPLAENNSTVYKAYISSAPVLLTVLDTAFTGSGSISAGSGTVSFDGTNTLTLNGATLEEVTGCVPVTSSINELTVNLIGTNTITVDGYLVQHAFEYTNASQAGTITFTHGTNGSLTVQESEPHNAISLTNDGYDASSNYKNGWDLNQSDESDKRVLTLTYTETYALNIAGTTVTSSNATNITGSNISGGTVSFDTTTNTLTLNGTKIYGNIVSDLENLNVVLIGSNLLGEGVKFTTNSEESRTVSFSTTTTNPGLLEIYGSNLTQLSDICGDNVTLNCTSPLDFVQGSSSSTIMIPIPQAFAKLDHGVVFTDEPITLGMDTPSELFDIYYKTKSNANGNAVKYETPFTLTTSDSGNASIEIYTALKDSPESTIYHSYFNYRTLVVLTRPTFSPAAGTYDAAQAVTLNGLPELGTGTGYYEDQEIQVPQVRYYFDDASGSPIQYQAGAEIDIAESKTLNAYILALNDSNTVVRSSILSAEYIIKKEPFYYYRNSDEGNKIKTDLEGTISISEQDLPSFYKDPDFNGTITYTSSDPTIATIDNEGTITVVKYDHEKTVTITATSEATETFLAGNSSYSLTAMPTEYALDIKPIETEVFTVKMGETFNLPKLTSSEETEHKGSQNLTVHPNARGAGIALIWTSEATETVQITESDDYFVITPLSVGQATIKATIPAENGYSEADGSFTLSIEKGTPTLTYSAESSTAVIGDETWVAPTLTNTCQVPVTYSSSNEAVATISNGGIVAPTGARPLRSPGDGGNNDRGVITLVGVGQTTITAAFAGNDNFEAAESATYTLTVKKNIADLTITAENQTYTGSPIETRVTVKDGETTLEGDFYTVTYPDQHTNPGTVTITITAKEDSYYTGSATATFTIAAMSIEAANVEVSGEYTYTGSAITPTITVALPDAEPLNVKTDYEVTYKSGEDVVESIVNAGEYTVTVTGKGNYSGTTEPAAFTIAKADLADVNLEVAELTYTGEALTPALTIKLGSVDIAAEEYTATYKKGETAVEEVKEAGTYTVTLTSTGKNFTTTNTKTAQFSVVAATAAITASNQTTTYNGEAQAIGGVTVSKGTAVITYYPTEEDRTNKNNGSTDAPKNAGTYYVQVTQGNANYSSEAVNVTYTIEKATITSVTLDKTSLSYNGKEQTVNVTEVKAGELTLQEKDYTVSGNTATEIGKHTVTVTAAVAEGNNFTGSATAEFSIGENALTAEMVQLATTEYVYDGTAKKPEVIAQGLTLGTDYTVAYTDSINAGTAKATVTGKGGYTGTVELTYTISKADFAGVTIAEIADLTYTSEALTPTLDVTLNSLAVAAEEYTAAYRKGETAVEEVKEAGTYTVVLTSTGKNFTAGGEKTASFKVVAATATITATDQTVTYNGEAQAISGVTASKGTAVITYYATAEDRTAKENGSTQAPTNAGTYYVQVTQGDNNYSSEAVNVTYTIEKATITSVTLDKTSLNYTGKELTVNVTEVKAGELTLQEKDYTVSGNTATEIGKHTVTVTAAVAEGNNFTGSATAEFTIGEKALTTEMVQLATTEYVYDGTAKKPEVIAQGLTLGTDYTVAYTDSINAGTAKATVTGKGGYTGTVELTYTISKADFAGVTIAEIADLTYTGEALTPTLNVTLNSLAVAAEEYTAAYRRGETAVEEVKEAGTYTVVLTSTGKNFVAEGQKTASFKVVAGSATITATDQTVTYNGEAQAISGVTANKGTAVITYYATAADRTAKENGSTEAPTNAGTYYVQVTQGNANYSSEAVNVTYTIEKATITSVTLDKTSLSYTGKEQTVNVTEVKAGELTLQEKDYTVSGNAATEIGKHTVTVTAAVAEGNNFTGSATTEFSIGENALTAEMVQLATTEYVYDGTAKKPEVIAQGLTLGTDYTVAYTDSINAGTAKATVTGKGGYTGTVELTLHHQQGRLRWCHHRRDSRPDLYRRGTDADAERDAQLTRRCSRGIYCRIQEGRDDC